MKQGDISHLEDNCNYYIEDSNQNHFEIYIKITFNYFS